MLLTIRPAQVVFSFNKKVINLSKISFESHVFRHLEKGLNFALAPRKIPMEEIICNIEYGIKGLSNPIKYIIRQDCAMILRKAKPPNRNTSKSEFETLKALNNNLNIVILKADKGGVVVIIDREGYRNKMIDHICNNVAIESLTRTP